jgi:hypothetical protein
VIAKVEWHPRELYPRVGSIVTNLSRPAERVVAFYNKRGTCEQWIKEGKSAIKWTRLSCRTFAANAVWLQLHALAYNLGNFLRTLATPEPITDWSLTSLREADQDRREGGEPGSLSFVSRPRRCPNSSMSLDQFNSQRARSLPGDWNMLRRIEASVEQFPRGKVTR